MTPVKNAMISAIVLAAGKATRFGKCKPLMMLGQRTLLDHVLGTLREARVDDVVVVLGDRADEIDRAVHFEGERVVINPDFADGMSTSIQAGLRSLPPAIEAVLMVLADQPLVTPQTVNHLIDEYRRLRPAIAVPAYHGRRGNPVVVDRSLFVEMMGLRGDIGCRAIFGNHIESLIEVPVEDRGVVIDIDTPEDLERVAASGSL